MAGTIQWDNDMNTYERLYTLVPEPNISAFHPSESLGIVKKDGEVVMVKKGEFVKVEGGLILPV